MLQNVNIGQLLSIVLAIALMSGIFVGLGATFVAFTNAIKEIPVQYIGLAIAVLGGLTLALLSFAGAIVAIANAPLGKLAVGMAALWVVGGKMAAVGAAFGEQRGKDFWITLAWWFLMSYAASAVIFWIGSLFELAWWGGLILVLSLLQRPFLLD